MKLDLPPGVYRNGTELQSQGRYYDADLMRWFEGTMRPVGGWRQKGAESVTGKARGILTWKDNDNQAWLGIGTHTDLFVMSRAGALSNITPYRATASLTDPFTTTNGSAVVTVADTAHGGSTGDYVVFSGATAVGGITLSGAYEMTVTGVDAYTVTHSSAATSAASGGGSVTASYRIQAGIGDATTGAGYGAGLYGVGTYGTPRPDSTNIIPATVWSLDSWGEYLVAISSDDTIAYEWQLSTSTAAAAIANAPTGIALVVTEKRHMMILGAGGNPRKVEWSDLEDNTTWTPTATNEAGGKELQTAGKLMCGKRVPNGTLLFTDIDVHFARYLGQPRIYEINRVGSACGVISQQAVAVAGSLVFWMGPSGFFSFADGVVSPLVSDVGDYVFNDINAAQASKVYAFHNSAFGEAWWFYPSASSIEVDRYVCFNYREGHWAIGSLARTCATDRSVLQFPVAVDADGVVYEHEVGLDWGTIEPYALAGPVDLGKTVTVLKVIPDERTLGDVEVRFLTRMFPMGDQTTVAAVSPAEQTDVRFTARYVSPEYRSTGANDFRIGAFDFEIRERGRR